MRRRWKIIAICFVMVLLAAFVGSFWSSAEYKICSLNEYTHVNECAERHLGPFLLSWILNVAEAHNGLLTAVATIFVAGFTWTLWQSSEKMWKATKISAEAADLTAKALTIVEFPIIRTAWVGPELLAVDRIPESNAPYGGTVNGGPPTRFSVVSAVEYTNYGRSPAFPIGMLLGYAVTNELPGVPNYKSKAEISPSAILKEKDTSAIEIHYGLELTDEEIGRIESGTAKFWFYVRMTYLDIMDRPYFIASCWQWGRLNPGDAFSYFFDDGTAPGAYTRRGSEQVVNL